MKRLLSVILVVLLLCGPVVYADTALDRNDIMYGWEKIQEYIYPAFEENGALKSSPDDELVAAAFFGLSDKVATVTLSETLSYLKSSNVPYEHKDGSSDVTVPCPEGRISISFYPLDRDAKNAFKDPSLLVLSSLYYSRDEAWMKIDDKYHMNAPEITQKKGGFVETGSNALSLLMWYNHDVGGHISLDVADDKLFLTNSVRIDRIKSATKTVFSGLSNRVSVEKVTTTQVIGTSDPSDYWISVYLDYLPDTLYGTARADIRTYSDSLSKSLAAQFDGVTVLWFYWEAPNISSSASVKYKYTVTNYPVVGARPSLASVDGTLK